MKLLSQIGNSVSTVKEAVEDFHDSKGGKWVAIAMMVGSVCTSLTALVNGYWHHEDTVAHFQKVDHFNNVMHGSNFVANVENAAKPQKENP